MELQHERSLPVRRADSALALWLLSFDAGAEAHAEDAFLADFARFARERDPAGDAGTTRFAVEVGRAALDVIDDVDGPWQALSIERWLDGLVATHATAPSAARGCERLCALARVFVDWLVMRGRLSLHGQRGLVRRIAAWRAADACGATNAVVACPPRAA
jgi:hypothetical protein